ncbi:hypothetical protein ACJX0J_016607 [Zea mays]
MNHQFCYAEICYGKTSIFHATSIKIISLKEKSLELEDRITTKSKILRSKQYGAFNYSSRLLLHSFTYAILKIADSTFTSQIIVLGAGDSGCYLIDVLKK